MNQPHPSYMDVHASHLSPAQPAYPAAHAPPAPVPYGHYPPSVLPAASSYGPPASYPPYTYSSAVSSPPSAPHVTHSLPPQPAPQLLPLPAMTTSPSYASSPPYIQPHTIDTTGQVAPPGAKPRVTATLWEDEGSLCFQVEAKGVCVARRDDNDMINGTKLLNVAGMTRGRRDGILKSEKVRHVVKIGPMHLKGVWIPFERALEFANKEKITELLYPLFVNNIGALLMHPSNPNRTNAMVAGPDRARFPPPAPPARPPSQSVMSGQLPQPLPPPPVCRPAINGPTTPSSLIGMAPTHPAYEWAGNVPSSQSVPLDSGLPSRSVPSTPPSSAAPAAMPTMPAYPGPAAYDSKPYYSAPPPASSQYAAAATAASQPVLPPRYPATYMDSKLEPPEDKDHHYSQPSANGPTEPAASEYESSYRSYQSSQWTPPGYPSRSAPSSNLYNVVSDTRSSANGSSTDSYSTGSTAPTAYSSSSLTGSGSSGKRSRDDDDDKSSDVAETPYEQKRRKTLDAGGTTLPALLPGLQPISAGGVRHR